MTFLQQQSEYMAAYNAQAQQAMNVSVLFILNTVDICSITNILYLQRFWSPEQAQQQPFVFPQFQPPMPQSRLHALPPPPQVLQFSLDLSFVLTFQILTKLDFVGSGVMGHNTPPLVIPALGGAYAGERATAEEVNLTNNSLE